MMGPHTIKDGLRGSVSYYCDPRFPDKIEDWKPRHWYMSLEVLRAWKAGEIELDMHISKKWLLFVTKENRKILNAYTSLQALKS